MRYSGFERVFDADQLPKRERVERTLNLQPVDRVVLHEQLSYNAGVISLYTGKRITGFDYSYEDICAVIRKTLDACFPPVAPLGTDRIVDEQGFVIQQDNWHSAIVSRPFRDVAGAREFLQRLTEQMQRFGRRGGYGYPPGIVPREQRDGSVGFDPGEERENYRRYMQGLQRLVGETVIIDFSIQTGFCDCWSRLGLDTFVYLYQDDPNTISDYIQAYTDAELQRLHAIADPGLSPVVLIAEDFASKNGPIFGPAFLQKELYPHVRRLTKAWQGHGLKVLYHSDGNWKAAIRDLITCGVDGFYCLEPALGMDVVELKRQWPQVTWAGGVDGVDLMERGTPEQVRREVHRQILETDALRSGGLFIDSSSEINPPVQPENFKAMVDAVGEILNPDLIPEAERTHR